MSTVEIKGHGFASGYWGEEALNKATDAIKDVATSVADRGSEALKKGINALDDVSSSVAHQSWDVITSVEDRTLRKVPGYDELSDAAKKLISDVVQGPLRDFASTTFGQTVLRAATIMVTQLPAGGPQLGQAAVAALNTASLVVPGMLEGKSFGNALADETIYRMKAVASYFGGELGNQVGKALADMIGPAVENLAKLAKSVYPQLPLDQAIDTLSKATGLNPAKLAEQMNLGKPANTIRADAVAIAFDIAGKTPHKWLGDGSNYDLRTGTVRFTAPTIQKMGRAKPPPAPAITRATTLQARSRVSELYALNKPAPAPAPAPAPVKSPAPVTYVQSPRLAPPPPPDLMMASNVSPQEETKAGGLSGVKIGIALGVFASAWWFFYKR